MRKTLLTITGPTAAGKTDLTVRAAQRGKTEIVSCDSRQIYRELSIGTAKPTLEEMDGVPHHFVNEVSIKNPISAGEFEKLAVKRINSLFQKYNTVILTGGSGLYLNAVLFGLDDFPDVTPEASERVGEIYDEKGLEGLKQTLKTKDPEYYNTVDLHNPVRLIRALEVIETTGKPFSEFRNHTPKSRPWKNDIYVLNRDRQELHTRIEERVDEMVQQGLFDEVQALQDFKNEKALQTVGYREIFDFLDGKTTKNECIELIKRNTRRYAKRQITWFKKIPNAHFCYPPYEEILKYDFQKK